MPILNIPVKEWGADLAEQAKRKAQAAMQQVQDAGGDAIAESQRQAKEARDEWMKTQIDAAMNPIREAGHAAAEGLSALGDRAQEAGQTAQQNLQQNASAVAEAPVGQAIGEKASGLGTFAQGVRQDLRKGADAAVAADTAMDTALSERDAADRASAPTIPEEVSAPPSFQVPGSTPMTADTMPNLVEFPTNVAKNYLGSMGKSAEDLTDPEEWKKTAAAAQEIAPEVLNPVQTGARLVSDKAARDTFVEEDLPAAGQVLKTVGDIGNVVPNPEEQLENVAASAALEATKNTGMPEPVKAGIAMAAGSGIPTNLLKRAFKVPGGLSSQLDEAGRAAMGNGKLAAVDGAGDIGDIPEPTQFPEMHRPSSDDFPVGANEEQSVRDTQDMLNLGAARKQQLLDAGLPADNGHYQYGSMPEAEWDRIKPPDADPDVARAAAQDVTERTLGPVDPTSKFPDPHMWGSGRTRALGRGTTPHGDPDLPEFPDTHGAPPEPVEIEFPERAPGEPRDPNGLMGPTREEAFGPRQPEQPTPLPDDDTAFGTPDADELRPGRPVDDPFAQDRGRGPYDPTQGPQTPPPSRAKRAQDALENGAGSDFYRRVEAGEFDHLDDGAFNKELIRDLTEPGESADQGLFSGTRPMEPLGPRTNEGPAPTGDYYDLGGDTVPPLGPERANFRVPGSGMSVADQIAGRTLGAVQGGIAGDRQDENDTGWQRAARIGGMAALGAAAPPQNVKAASLARGLLRNADRIGQGADELGVRAGAARDPGRRITAEGADELRRTYTANSPEPEPIDVFYSKLSRELDTLPERGTIAQVRATLKNRGVKPDEMAWSGMDDLLRDFENERGANGRITKKELQDNLQFSRVDLREVVNEISPGALEAKAKHEALWNEYRTAQRADADLSREYRRLQAEGDTAGAEAVKKEMEAAWQVRASMRGGLDEARREMERLATSGAEPQYENYSQPTAEGKKGSRPGYREILLTTRNRIEGGNYESSHWGTQNIPLHARVTDRTLPDGRKVLHIEEMQSDWHQAGRDQGYRYPYREVGAALPEAKAWEQRIGVARDAQAQHWADTNEQRTVLNRTITDDVEDDDPLTTNAALSRLRVLDEELDRLVASRQGVEQEAKDWARGNPARHEALAEAKVGAARAKERELFEARNAAQDRFDDEFNKGDIDDVGPEAVIAGNEVERLSDLYSHAKNELYSAKEDLDHLRLRKGAMVPSGPWQKSWPELGMKRLIRMAAEEGYDAVSWTPGKVQQERYGRSVEQAVRRLEFIPERQILRTIDHEGHMREIPGVTEDNLHNYVGQDLSQRLKATEPVSEVLPAAEGGVETYPAHTLEGPDLRFTESGSTGMNVHYDQVMPQAANKIAKPWGQRAYQGEIELSPGGERSPAHLLDITPEMRGEVTEKGFPLFIKDQQGGTSGMGLADQIAGRTAGAIQGGVAADRSDEDDTGWERAGRIATGAALGAAAKPANVNLASLARGAIRNADKLGGFLGDEAGELRITPGDGETPVPPRGKPSRDVGLGDLNDRGNYKNWLDNPPEGGFSAEQQQEMIRAGSRHGAAEAAERVKAPENAAPGSRAEQVELERRRRAERRAEGTPEPETPETPPAKPVEGESSQVDTGKSPDDPLGQKPESERKTREYTPEQQAEREAERARRAAALAAEREAKDAERAEARGRREAAQQAEREARARQKEAAAAVKKAQRDMEKAVSADEKRMARETLAEAKRMEREAEREAEEARRTWAASDKTEATTGQMPMDMEGNEGKGAQMGLPTESGVTPLTPEQQRVADALATPADANAPIAPGRHKLNDHDARARENLIRGHIREGQSLAQATKKVDDHFDTVLDARKDMKAPGIGDWVETVRYSGGLLSNPATAAGDFAAGLAETPWVYARNRLLDLGDPKAEWVRKAEQAGYGKGFKNGIGNFGEILKSGRELKELVPGAAAEDVPESVARRYAARGEYGRAKLAGAAELPMRVRNGLDAVNHGSLYSGLIYREAAKAVNKTDLTPGSPEWTEAVQRFVNKTADQDLAEDSAEFLARKRALREADRSLGRNDPGKIGTFLSGAFKQPPLRPFFPLFKTGYNIAMRGLERSPVGAGGIFVDKLLGREVTPERIMDSAMGSTLSMALTAYAVKSGNISGYGPEDQGTRDDLLAQGWKPWSVRLPDGRWYSYTRFGAAAAPLAMAGAVGDASQYHAPDEPPGERMKTAGGNFGRWFGNQFLLRSVGNIQDVTTNPKAKAGSYFGRMASQYTGTASLLGTPASMLDPYERDTEKGGVNPFVNEMIKNIPIARQSLDPKYDVFGEPVPNPASGWGTLNPYTPGPDPKAVDDRFRNLRKYTGSESAAEDRRIAQALAAWKAEAGGAGPPLGDEASDLANRFLGGNDIDYLFAKGEAKEAEAMRENERALARLGG